jgi:hypothetical protein
MCFCCSTHPSALFVAIGLFGAIPSPHAAYLIGLERSFPVMWPLALMAALYIGTTHFKVQLQLLLLLTNSKIAGGAGIYASQIPERFFPGGFFNHGWFTSHFWFHIFAVGAGIDVATKKI